MHSPGHEKGLAAVVAWAVLATWHPATADDVEVIDVKPVRNQLSVIRDGGHYIVVEAFKTGTEHLYFGDGKSLYQLVSLGGSQSGSERFSRSIWAPRQEHQAEVRFEDGLWTLQCGDRSTGFAIVGQDEADKVLDEGVFHKPLWKRSAYALARDDRGVYYYVDHLQDEYGGKGFRIFIGAKGRMKLAKMMNVVLDTEGAIFATKRGELRLILNRDEKDETFWVRGKQRIKLVTVPLRANIRLIYDELGVYEGELLGTPCDYY
jgi:hypothetical protein